MFFNIVRSPAEINSHIPTCTGHVYRTFHHVRFSRLRFTFMAFTLLALLCVHDGSLTQINCDSPFYLLSVGIDEPERVS